jgi:hypothetical protein
MTKTSKGHYISSLKKNNKSYFSIKIYGNQKSTIKSSINQSDVESCVIGHFDMHQSFRSCILSYSTLEKLLSFLSMC